MLNLNFDDPQFGKGAAARQDNSVMIVIFVNVVLSQLSEHLI